MLPPPDRHRRLFRLRHVDVFTNAAGTMLDEIVVYSRHDRRRQVTRVQISDWQTFPLAETQKRMRAFSTRSCLFQDVPAAMRRKRAVSLLSFFVP